VTDKPIRTETPSLCFPA